MESKPEQFKLKDLAIIFAVILALAPMLTATLKHTRAATEAVKCAENLKCIGVACEMYQQDYDDVLVPYGAPFAYGSMWPELLNRYAGTPGAALSPIFKCPQPPPTTGWAYERSYGINILSGGWMQGGTPVVVPVKKITYPHATIRVAESAWPMQGGSYFAPQPKDYYDENSHHFPERHMGKGNVLWMDGHVSSMTRAQYNTRDAGAYYGQIWLRFEAPKPAVPN